MLVTIALVKVPFLEKRSEPFYGVRCLAPDEHPDKVLKFLLAYPRNLLSARWYNNRIHKHGMALVVFFRGINVGGHRKLRPSALAGELGASALLTAWAL
jgi:hypothetical protein